ncbi:MAG: HDIG domain-containing protein [Prevotellaceae bacterium]|nr:HDIG domain-containing protein [Prevotellaceae bacterium]
MNLNPFRRRITANSPKSRKQQQRDNIRQWIFKSVLALVVTLVIVYFMPRQGGFNYEYRIGRPWPYGAIYAAQKFNIEMSDSAYHAKQDSMSRTFQPYYDADDAVRLRVKRQLHDLRVDELADNDTASRHLPLWKSVLLRPYYIHVSQLLDTIYAHGIMSPHEYDSLRQHGTPAIRIIDGNKATSRPLADIFSTTSAYEYIVGNQPDEFAPAILRQFNLNTILAENLTCDRIKSEQEHDALINEITNGIGIVMAGEKIVDRGELITPATDLKLRSYRTLINSQQQQDDRNHHTNGGRFVLILTIVSLLISYLSLFRRDYIEHPRASLLLFALLTLFSIAASLMVGHHFFHIYALPCCMLPIIVRVFLDSRTAYIFHVGTVLIISLTLNYPYEFLIFQLITGLIAIQNLRELSQRSQIIHTAAIITFFYILSYTAYELAIGTQLQDLDRYAYISILVSGLFLLFAYPLLWILEKSFGFISDVTLVELTNINHPLLQRMTEVAPGTFQHSMQVANLASEVAKQVGAKAQLVRTAALYHDIGKIERPVFFTENQSGANPHKHLTPLKSAEVIIAHVANGLALAESHNLPPVIRRFIATHHGRGMAKYFYITYCNQHPGEDVDRTPFTYKGPNPETIEEAILMMCDSVEAASRSLPEYTEESISQLVDRIIDTQVSEGYFQECNITFRQIAITKSVLKDRLKNIYHTRISYPELNAAADKRDNA